MTASSRTEAATVSQTAPLTIRRFGPEDSAEELASLLHRAFAGLGAMGLNFTAVDQTVDVTRQRIERGECFLALINQTLAGTILLEHWNPESSCQWFADSSLASAHQLAVAPEFRRHGIGARLMNFGEQWAIRHDYAGICIDTAEPATHLIAFYVALGYERVGFQQWKGKRYRSVIMRKLFVTSRA